MEKKCNYTAKILPYSCEFWKHVMVIAKIFIPIRMNEKSWKRFSQPALTANSSSLLSLTVAYICLAIALIVLWDTHSWRARLLITHPRMFTSGSLLAFFLPPPGSLALSLSFSERRWSSVLFFRQSWELKLSELRLTPSLLVLNWIFLISDYWS